MISRLYSMTPPLESLTIWEIGVLRSYKSNCYTNSPSIPRKKPSSSLDKTLFPPVNFYQPTKSRSRIFLKLLNPFTPLSLVWGEKFSNKIQKKLMSNLFHLKNFKKFFSITLMKQLIWPRIWKKWYENIKTTTIQTNLRKRFLHLF